MTEIITFTYQIDPLWDTVNKIRDKVELILREKGEELNDASKMTASELIENAVKYGCSITKGRGIQFELIANENLIRISVTNRINSMDDYQSVQMHIDAINASNNPQELYIDRLMNLMENPKINKSQLGLYRIAYEGEFYLNYTFQNSILTITAQRKI